MFRLKDGWKAAKLSLRSGESETAMNKKSPAYPFKYGPVKKKTKKSSGEKTLKKCLGCAFFAGRCLLQLVVLVWRSALESRLVVCVVLVIVEGVWVVVVPSRIHHLASTTPPPPTIRHCQWQLRFDQLHCRRLHSSSFIQCRIGFGPHGVCVLCEIPHKKLFRCESQKRGKRTLSRHKTSIFTSLPTAFA